jgi:hypothetical protein
MFSKRKTTERQAIGGKPGRFSFGDRGSDELGLLAPNGRLHVVGPVLERPGGGILV